MYTMRKTPKSTFLFGTGDATTTITSTPVYTPVVVSPPFAPPSASASSSKYLMYALVGGGALVAYLLFRKAG